MTAPLGRATIKSNLDDFAHHWRQRIDGWRETDQGHTEKSAAQQFWSDLFRCFGIIPERIDLFERDAARASTGRTGYIDLFWSGVVIGEAKSLGRDLDAAFTQTLDYLAGGSIGQHEWPKYIIVSDFENIHLTRLGDEGWTVRFTIDEITDHLDQLKFLAGVDTVTKQEEEEASIQASKLMADLYTAMVGADADEKVGEEEAPVNPEEEEEIVQRTSIFMTRLLFLLYGDDAGLWEEDLFYRFVENEKRSEALGAQLNYLFQVLNTPESRRRRVPDDMAAFPYVNGSLFEENLPVESFTHDMREALLAACRFQWTRISPAIFGSMFQLVKSKEARRRFGEHTIFGSMFQLVKSKEARRRFGEHYTSENNILRTIEPLFLTELREESDRLIHSKNTSAAALRRFRDRLADMIFLDPACGCGNFLVVAYRELRRIETDIIVALRAREGELTASMDITFDQRLNIDQFYGFEINWWPAKIAETAMFLVDHQANRELAARIGDAPERLPIKTTAHIFHGDALAQEWSTLIPKSKETWIFGNPPFIGHRGRTAEIRAGLQRAWGTNPSGHLDYVTAWHAMSLKLLRDRAGAFAFVTTNSITQGQCVAPLFGPIADEGWTIDFAYRTFLWDSEAPGKAAVKCVIIGFRRERKGKGLLWEEQGGEMVKIPLTTGINPYLLDAPWVIVPRRGKPLSPQLPTLSFGTMAADGNNLLITSKEAYEDFMKDPIASKYVRANVGATGITQSKRRWCLWLEDVPGTEINKSPLLKARVEACREWRTNRGEKYPNGDAYKLRDTPALMRPNRSRPEVSYLAIPRHFSENYSRLPAAHFPPEVIGSDAIFQAEDPDGFMFAIITSSMYMAWQKAVGGGLKTDPRFGKETTWHTLPIPEVNDAKRRKICDAGARVLERRAEFPELTLADIYHKDGTLTQFKEVHDALDREVDTAFGAPRKLQSDRQRQEYLFKHYAELIRPESATPLHH